jgi:putative transposase
MELHDDRWTQYRPASVPALEPLAEQLAQASPDLMRGMPETFNTLLSGQADSVCGAEYGSRSPDLSHRRNGYRHRDLDTRVGTVDVVVPKLREGSFFPDSENVVLGLVERV